MPVLRSSRGPRRAVVPPRSCRRPIAILLSLLCVPVAGAAAVVEADADAVPTLPEMTVTARKLAEDARKVPISMTVVDAQGLEDRRIDNVETLLRATPGLGFSWLGDGRSSFQSIRGIGPMSQPLGHDDSSVVTYVDGVPQPLFGADQMLLDLERVEVLRGPQGTVFGRNAQAGAVSFTTRKPGPERAFTLRAEAGLDSASRDRVEAVLSGPIRADRLAGRLAVAYGDLGADVRNLAGGDLGRSRNTAFRGSLVATPSADTDLTLSAFGQRDRANPSNFVVKGGGFPQVALAPKGWIERDLSSLSLTARHRLDDVELVSVTAFNRYAFENLTNNSEALTFSRVFGMPVAAFLPATDWSTYDERQNTFYQELRLASRGDAATATRRWVAGLTYTHDDYRMDSYYVSPFFVSTNGWRENRYKTGSQAIFGELTQRLGERWEATAGLRYTHERKRYSSTFTSNGFAGTVPTHTQDGTLNFDLLTGRLALNYALSDDAVLYASAARGAKSGGFPNFTNNAPTGGRDEPYRESRSWSYEVGSKTSLLGGRAQLNAALFYNEVEDENLMALDSASFMFVPKPIGTRSHGGELELGWRLSRSLQLNASAALTRSRISEVSEEVAAFSGARHGNRVPGVAKYQYALSVDYRDGAGWLGLPQAALSASLAYQYVGRRAADVANHFDLAAYGLVNARAALEFDDWEVYLFGENLGDKRPEYLGIYYGADAHTVTVGHGRVIGVGTRIRF